MLAKVLFREYDYPNNVISTTRGSTAVTGTGTKFTEMPAGTIIEAEGNVLGMVASVESDTALTLQAVSSVTLSNVSWYQDWSIWRIESSIINRKVESDNPGEAGAVVFDNVTMTFYMGDSLRINNVDYPNPVKSAFAGDLDSKKRFIIKIQGIKYDFPDEPQRLITSSFNHLIDSAGKYLTIAFRQIVSRTIFEGVVDFTTITEPTYPGDDAEFSDIITFDVVDKLSALNTLTTIATRINGFITPDVTNDTDIDQVAYYKWWDRDDFGIYYRHDAGGGSFNDREINDSNAPNLGDLININFLNGQSGSEDYLALITFKYLDTIEFSNYHRMYYFILPNMNGWNAGTTDGNKAGSCDSIIRNATTQKWVDGLFNNEEIFITQTSTKNIKGYAGITSVIGTEITAIDGIKLISAILKQRWPDAEVINKLKDGSGNHLATFPLPLNFIFQLLDEFPFGKETLDALTYVTNAIDCYIFTNTDGNFVLQNNNSFEFPDTTPPLTVIELIKNRIKSVEKKRFWDKLVDSVVCNVTSWIPNPDDASQYLDGIGYAFKVTGIKPRNEMTKDVIIDQATLDRYGFTVNSNGTLSYSGLTDQIDILNKYGDLKAAEKLDFYGKRHDSNEVEMAHITWDILPWELLFLFDYYGANYFMTNLGIDVDEDSIQFIMASVARYDYNLDNVIIGKQRDEYLAGN